MRHLSGTSPITHATGMASVRIVFAHLNRGIRAGPYLRPHGAGGGVPRAGKAEPPSRHTAPPALPRRPARSQPASLHAPRRCACVLFPPPPHGLHLRIAAFPPAKPRVFLLTLRRRCKHGSRCVHIERIPFSHCLIACALTLPRALRTRMV